MPIRIHRKAAMHGRPHDPALVGPGPARVRPGPIPVSFRSLASRWSSPKGERRDVGHPPSPSWGGDGGGGMPRLDRASPPLPIPPPQGGREALALLRHGSGQVFLRPDPTLIAVAGALSEQMPQVRHLRDDGMKPRQERIAIARRDFGKDGPEGADKADNCGSMIVGDDPCRHA